MNSLARYKYIYIDIDDTLIYGFWTDLMKHSWNFLHNDVVAACLMGLQYLFCLYRVNRRLVYLAKEARDFHGAKIIFLTVRAPHSGTRLMLQDIMEDDDFTLIELATDAGHILKPSLILAMFKNAEASVLIDDNDKIREECTKLGIAVLNPTGMYEEKVG